MKCPDLGLLRAHIDGELEAGESGVIAQHLAACQNCSAKRMELQATVSSVTALLKCDIESVPTAAASLTLVQERLRVTQQQRGPFSGWRRIWINPWGRLAAASAATAVLVALVAFTPMRTAADGLLAVFRVQQFAAVTIDVGMLPMLSSLEKASLSGITLPPMLPPSVKEVTLSEAANSVDFPVRQPQYLPGSLSSQTRVLLSSPMEYTYTVDLTQARQALQVVGGQDIQLPQGLDGATLTARMPGAIATLYGALASFDEGATAPATGNSSLDYLVLIQTRGPTVEVPDTVDVEALRDGLLALPILPADLVRQLRAVKDWRHTLVIPVPSGAHKDVTVGGVPGLLIAANDRANTLLWQKDGVVYGLSGSIGEGEMMRIANSLR